MGVPKGLMFVRERVLSPPLPRPPPHLPFPPQELFSPWLFLYIYDLVAVEKASILRESFRFHGRVSFPIMHLSEGMHHL